MASLALGLLLLLFAPFPSPSAMIPVKKVGTDFRPWWIRSWMNQHLLLLLVGFSSVPLFAGGYCGVCVFSLLWLASILCL